MGAPGQAGCVVLWEILVPGQPDWLLQTGSDGVEPFPLSFSFPCLALISFWAQRLDLG